MDTEAHALIEKRKDEIRAKMTSALEDNYIVQIGPLKRVRMHFPEGDFYWGLITACEGAKDFFALEGLVAYLVESKTGAERRLRDISNFSIPFLIALLALLMTLVIIKGELPSLPLFLAIFLIFSVTMIVLLADEMANNQKIQVFSLMHEYCILLLLGREKKKTIVIDELLKGLLSKKSPP